MEWKVCIAFCVVASTSLLPYNLFMNAHEYFYYKLRNVSSSIDNSSLLPIVEETPYQRAFEGYLTVFGGITCIIGATLNLLFTNKFSNTSRVVFGHLLVAAVFIPTICYTYIDTDDDQDDFFYISLVLAAVASFGSMGLIGGGIMGLAATYPSIYMQSVMCGQAIAGILSAALSIACQAFTSSEVVNGRIYFIIAISWTLISVAFFLYLARIGDKRNAAAGAEYSRINIEDERPLLDGDDEELHVESGNSTPSTTDGDDGKGEYKTVFKQARLDLASVSVVLLVTLAGFPAVSSLVKSTSHNEKWTHYFSAVCCFLMFNIGDACGRLLGNTVDISGYRLLSLCSLRVLFVPLIMVCNVEPRFVLPTLLPYDGVFLLIVLLFAITHGFTITLSIMGVAKSVDEELREVSGSLVNLACVISALCGSLLGVVLVDVL